MNKDLLLLKWCPEMAIYVLSVNSRSPEASYTYTEEQLTTLIDKFKAVGGKMDFEGWTKKAKSNPNVWVMYFAEKIRKVS